MKWPCPLIKSIPRVANNQSSINATEVSKKLRDDLNKKVDRLLERATINGEDGWFLSIIKDTHGGDSCDCD